MEKTSKVLLCLDFNYTIDDIPELIAKSESYGSQRNPTFCQSLIKLAFATKMPVEIAIITAAELTNDFLDDVATVNFCIKDRLGVAALDKTQPIRYVIGGKNQEFFDFKTKEHINLHNEQGTKKDGVEALLKQIGTEDIGLIVAGGDTKKEDTCMIEADTKGIPKFFVAPKSNKDCDNYPDTVAIRDHKYNGSEGVGRCIKKFAEAYTVQEKDSDQETTEIIEETTRAVISTPATQVDNVPSVEIISEPEKVSDDKATQESDSLQPSQFESIKAEIIKSHTVLAPESVDATIVNAVSLEE